MDYTIWLDDFTYIDSNHLVFVVEMIFFIELRALDATKIGDNDRRTACFFNFTFFSSDFSRSICVLLSVRLPRFIDILATGLQLVIALVHGVDDRFAHFVDVRLRFRQMMRGVNVVTVVLSVHGVVLFKTLPLSTSASVNGLFRLATSSGNDTFACEHSRTWLVLRLVIRNGTVDTVARSHRLSHKLVATVLERLRCKWLRWLFATGCWSSKQCECVNTEAHGMFRLPLRCIEIDRDRFMSSLLHFDEPQPVQLSVSLVGYVWSLLLLFCTAPDFRISITSANCGSQLDECCCCCCCCSLIR